MRSRSFSARSGHTVSNFLPVSVYNDMQAITYWCTDVINGAETNTRFTYMFTQLHFYTYVCTKRVFGCVLFSEWF